MMGVDDVLKVVLLLIGFCALLFLTYVTTRYVGGKQNKAMKGRNISVLETVSLGPDKRLHLVKAGNTHVLIASTSKTVEFLTVVTLEEPEREGEPGRIGEQQAETATSLGRIGEQQTETATSPGRMGEQQAEAATSPGRMGRQQAKPGNGSGEDGGLFDFKSLFDKYIGAYKTGKNHGDKAHDGRQATDMPEDRNFRTNLGRLKKMIQKNEIVQENGDDNTNEE